MLIDKEYPTGLEKIEEKLNMSKVDITFYFDHTKQSKNDKTFCEKLCMQTGMIAYVESSNILGSNNNLTEVLCAVRGDFTSEQIWSKLKAMGGFTSCDVQYHDK
jgi:hypothetical protein